MKKKNYNIWSDSQCKLWFVICKNTNIFFAKHLSKSGENNPTSTINTMCFDWFFYELDFTLRLFFLVVYILLVQNQHLSKLVKWLLHSKIIMISQYLNDANIVYNQCSLRSIDTIRRNLAHDMFDNSIIHALQVVELYPSFQPSYDLFSQQVIIKKWKISVSHKTYISICLSRSRATSIIRRGNF